MSKAGEWAKRRAEYEASRPIQPPAASLMLGPGREVMIWCDPDGKARLNTPLVMNDEVPADELCRWALQILDTFSDGPSA